MKQLLFVLFSILSLTAASQTTQLVGNWNSDCTWDPPPCGGGSDVPNINNAATTANIGHGVTLDINLTGGNQVKGDININAGGSLTGAAYNVDISTSGSLNLVSGNASINDITVGGSGTLTIANGCTLTVNGSATFAVNSVVNIASGGVMIITGNLTNNNNSTGITVNGTVTVGGNLDAGTGSSIDGTTGSITVTGSITTTGTAVIFGSTADCASNCVTTSGNPLPVDLNSFNAYYDKPDDCVYVIWSTSSEKNNDFFTIERSHDGKHFEPIASQKGAGNSNELLHYEFKDLSHLIGESYYRLKQTDIDGKFKYYPPVSVSNHQVEKIKNLNIHPNPAVNSDFTMVLEGFHDEVDLVIHDLNGKEFFVHTLVDVKDGEIVTSKNLNINLVPGVYIIVAGNKKDMLNKRLIVK